MERSSGILLHISSLPSAYGIGTLGKSAYEYADFLSLAGQRYWQMLPIGHTGYGDSPYQAFSMYAGNPYFIDLDLLIADGLLKESELSSRFWGSDPAQVDYGAVYKNRFEVLRLAYRRGFDRLRDEVEGFRGENSHWIEDYALFMAVKAHFGGVSWLDWEDDEIRLRKPDALARYSRLLREDIEFFIFIQYLFWKQWTALREYVRERGIKLIGDLPIYLSPDSAEVWANPAYFELDEDGRPLAVAGVPPDAFSATGQLWGNPLYNWEAVKASGWKLWLDRIRAAGSQFDVVRIDHFRGFESYWRVPYGEKTAENGEWVKGPDIELINIIREKFPHLEIIAEDLGFLTDDTRRLLRDSGFPGMKVLQFAFDSREPSDYLPHTYGRRCVCYTGTHDNSTAQGWYDELTALSEDDRRYANDYLGLNETEGVSWGLIRGGMSSVANLFVAQMQDYLELDGSARQNRPGTASGNWRWRLRGGECTPELSAKIARYTRLFGR